MTLVNNNPAQPPHNRDAEEAVLGSILINPECYLDVALILKSNDFFIQRNAWIWHAFTSLHIEGKEIDLVTVSDVINRSGKLAELGGSAYITSLINQVPSSLNAASYARIVKECSMRRRYIYIANNIATAAYDESNDVGKINSKIRDLLDANEVADNSFVHISKPLHEIYDDIESAEGNKREVWGLPTGLSRFDKATGGIQNGDLVWLAGEPGIGKTWSLTQLSLSMASVSPGALISMEMNDKAVVRRALSGLSGLRIKSMRSGIDLPSNWRTIFGNWAGVLESLPIYVSDKTMSTDQLRASLKVLKREYGIKWFGVDYALLFADQAENEIVRTEIISRNLKHICKDLELAGVVLQSVIKAGMDNSGNGGIKNIMRGSGQMIHDADLILFLTKFQSISESDNSIRDDERERIVTLWTTKGRELETLPTEHLIRKNNSPFFEELDMQKLLRDRNKQPHIKDADISPNQ